MDYGTDFPSVRDIRIDTSFSRPQSGGRDLLAEPIPRDRYSRHSNQSQPRIRDVTWISTSQSQIPSAHTHPYTPQTPRYNPTPSFPVPQARTPTPPVLRKSVPTITESEIEAEYMTVSVDERDDCNYGGHGSAFDGVALTSGRSEKKHTLGGFVSGLRRLPKVMSKSRLRDNRDKPDRQGTGTTAASTFETGRTVTTFPRYAGPSMPGGIPMSNSDDIPTVERLETPPRASSVSPHPRHPNPADSDTSIGDARRDRLMLSAVREHSYEHSLHPSLHLPRAHSRSDNTSTSSQPFERGGEGPHAMSTPRLSSPILAEPRPSADFKKMESPIRPPPAESVRSQIARARKFVRDLSNLPWIASSGVSSIYVPGEATSRRYSRPIAKQHGSWYTPRAKPIDLLAGPSTTGLLSPQQPIAVPHPPVLPHPFILGSSANLLFTQPPPHIGGGGGSGGGGGGGVMGGGGGGGSGSSPSHEGPPSTDSHGSQAPVLAPAYVAQPLFVYPSGLPQPGGPPEAAFPRPVYMFANSSPQFMSSSQDGGMGVGMGMGGQRLFVSQPSGLRTPMFG